MHLTFFSLLLGFQSCLKRVSRVRVGLNLARRRIFFSKYASRWTSVVFIIAYSEHLLYLYIIVLYKQQFRKNALFEYVRMLGSHV